MSVAETDPLCSGPWLVWSILCFPADTGVYRIGPWDPVSQLGYMWFFLPLSSPQYSGWLSFHHCLLVVSMTPQQLSWWSLRIPRVQWGVKVPLQFFLFVNGIKSTKHESTSKHVNIKSNQISTQKHTWWLDRCHFVWHQRFTTANLVDSTDSEVISLVS